MSAKERDEAVAETILDANHMKMYGGSDGAAADKEVTELAAKHGYPRLLKAATELL